MVICTDILSLVRICFSLVHFLNFLSCPFLSYFQHFGAANCHFESVCNILQFEPVSSVGINNMLVPNCSCNMLVCNYDSFRVQVSLFFSRFPLFFPGLLFHCKMHKPPAHNLREATLNFSFSARRTVETSCLGCIVMPGLGSLDHGSSERARN